MITSLSNPHVKQVAQWQTKAKERRKDRVFVAEGVKMFSEAPEPLVREVYIVSEFLEKLGKSSGTSERNREILLKLERTGFEEVSEEVFARMSDTCTPQGILAVMEQPVYELDSLMDVKDSLFVILEDLQDPGNLGTIIRTGEGAGITAVIANPSTVDVFNPKVIRSTMGSIYRVPVIYEENLCETVERLNGCGIKTYAAHLKGEVYYDSFSFKGSTAFLIGNEGKGLTKELAEAASSYLKIPMEGSLESLNAGVAAALLMYEAYRQRNSGL